MTSTAFRVAALRSSPPSTGAARAAKARERKKKKGEDDVDAFVAADSSRAKPPLMLLQLLRQAAASAARRSIDLAIGRARACALFRSSERSKCREKEKYRKEKSITPCQCQVESLVNDQRSNRSLSLSRANASVRSNFDPLELAQPFPVLFNKERRNHNVSDANTNTFDISSSLSPSLSPHRHLLRLFGREPPRIQAGCRRAGDRDGQERDRAGVRR